MPNCSLGRLINGICDMALFQVISNELYVPCLMNELYVPCLMNELYVPCLMNVDVIFTYVLYCFSK